MALAAKRTPYCVAHSGDRKCEYPKCGKYAQGRTRYCIGHGGGRRCTVQGCTKGARDKVKCSESQRTSHIIVSLMMLANFLSFFAYCSCSALGTGVAKDAKWRDAQGAPWEDVESVRATGEGGGVNSWVVPKAHSPARPFASGTVGERSASCRTAKRSLVERLPCACRTTCSRKRLRLVRSPIQP